MRSVVKRDSAALRQAVGGVKAGGRSAATSFQVTYLDPDCGRIRTEIFDDAAEADRFASRCIADEDGWAVVDAVRPRSSRKAA